MALQLSLGTIGAVNLAADGDLSKRLQPGIDTLVRFDPRVLNVLPTRIADLPSGSISSDFSFDVGPSWQVSQAVGITLSIEPEASCSLGLIKPGEELFQLDVANDNTPVNAAPGCYYLSIGFECGLTLDAGAQWSNGTFGISGDVSAGAKFRICNYCKVPESATLSDALVQAFSHFALPFQQASVAAMPDGNYIEFEFIGKLALGFGATYGFSGLFLAGRSNGEVAASFSSAVGQGVISAKPSYQVGAAFKLQYEHSGAFRVIAGRSNSAGQNGAILYLLRGEARGVSATESVGITLGAGATFQTDASTLQGEIQKAVAGAFPGKSGTALGSKLSASAGSLVDAVNSGANALLARADGHQITLQAMQSRLTANAALFIYEFDFNNDGLAAWDCAMRGDYATAVTLPGVTLDPRSMVERLYVQSAGLDIKLFDLLHYHSVEDYIQRTDVSYAGGRTFQVRDTVGLKAVSGLFGKERLADLYFIADSKHAAGVTDLHVLLQAVFQDVNNADASAETSRMLTALGQTPATPPSVTLEADAARFTGLPSDGPTAYEGFTRAVADVIGPANSVAQTFLDRFATYPDWVAFDRATDGNPNGDRWPTGYPPYVRGQRLLVQTYILAGQHFMDFCAGLKELATDVPGVTDDAQYEKLLAAINGMIHRDFAFPTYFLKPAMVAVMRLAGITPAISGAAAST
ncbi:MAG TPA: hypothetical protein VMJ75_07725 [Candidatus Acidoferrales bacterium]|nr:hypothetical protein [Candidatus Acidoferrales bacterium]